MLLDLIAFLLSCSSSVVGVDSSGCYKIFHFSVPMLSRKVDWSILAQCDFYAVLNLVQTDDRVAMRTVEPLKEPIFYRKLEKCSYWKDAYRTVCSAYENLRPDFIICHDDYGGYRLLYNGKTSVAAPHVFQKKPVGFIRALPEGVATNLSIMTSKRTGQELILLGPLRFINSDCNPNCEFDFSSESGIVQLRAKRKIKPGDEILVKYGPEYFENNTCLCRTCKILEKEQEIRCIVFDNLLDELLEELSAEYLDDEANQLEQTVRGKSPEFLPTRKRRRIKGRELIETFNELEGSPPDLHFSTNVSKKNHEDPRLQSKKLNDTPPAETSDILTSDRTQTETEVSEAAVSCQMMRASSPLRSYVSLDCSLSTVTKDHISLSVPLHDDEEEENLEPLFNGSQTSTKDASILAELFCSKFNLSDECSNSLFSLIKVVLPEDNKFPSGYSHIKNIKSNFDDNVRFFTQTADYSLCILNYTFQLRDIISRYFREITQHSQFRKANPCKDFKASLCPIVEWNTRRKTIINLIIFSDGVNLKKSTFKKEVWPLWIQIADLPPKMRTARKNIVLGALFVGDSHPPWKLLVQHLKDELSSIVRIKINEETFCTVVFKVRLLVADLGAKSHMLNMLKFNGYYGCHYCTAEGQTIGRTHAYYPYNQQGIIRDPETNDVFVEMAETLSVMQKLKLEGKDKKINVVGVRGKSAFAEVIEGLPLSAPIDYMHCVLSGVFSEVLKTCYQSLSKAQKEETNSEVS